MKIRLIYAFTNILSSRSLMNHLRMKSSYKNIIGFVFCILTVLTCDYWLWVTPSSKIVLGLNKIYSLEFIQGEIEDI